MEPSTLLLLIAVLACPIGMGVMMWLMNKNMNGQPNMSDHQTPAERLAALRAQREKLEAEIAEVSKITELEAKRDALLTSAKSGNGPQPKEAVH